MRTVTAIALAVTMTYSLVASAFAQTTTATTTTIPRYTVIPVTIQEQLSSATNRIGDIFTAKCSGNCGGFPSGTTFTGEVVSVTKASKGVPGQIEVRFTDATLPNGLLIPISGNLTSLNRNDVTTDPNTGRLVQKAEVRNQRNKFLAYGAGAGLLIGVLSGGNAFKGALIGAIAGYLAGSTLGKSTKYSDVTVPTGTEFGIALQRDVVLNTSSGAGAGSGIGTIPGNVTPTYTVTFGHLMPFRTASGVLMIPFRDVMNQIDQPFRYNSRTRTVTLNTDNEQIRHRVNSRVMYVNGQSRILDATSRMVNGNLYVSSDFVSAVTGMDVAYQSDTGSLLVY